MDLDAKDHGWLYGERPDAAPDGKRTLWRTWDAHPEDAPETLTEMEWKAILDAMLLTEEQCPLVSDAHLTAKEKVRAAIPYPTARGLFDAPGGPWWIHTAEDGWTLQNDDCDPPKVWYFPAASESGNSDTSFTVEIVELFRDALNRVDRLKGEKDG